MATKFGRKKHKQNNVFRTVITAILLCAIFLAAIVYLYDKTEDTEYENLHVQTKQIKDDIILQLISDRENLSTMASFAAKLYKDGDNYDLLFESFKPIGLFSRIGILTQDGIFITKDETIDLSDKISFEEEASKGIYTTGRTYSYSISGEEVVRSAVPIVVKDKTVGIMYGIIKTDKIRERYAAMAEELNAQLFVCDKENGDLIIDTVHRDLGNISFLKEREYNDDYSYEQLKTTENGFLSFKSAYRNENLLLHYSTIEEFDWMIAFGRYDSQVFASTHEMVKKLAFIFLFMIAIIVLYILTLMANERKTNSVTECASNVRKELLETADGQDNIVDALKEICEFTVARSTIFFDTDGESYYYILPKYEELVLSEDERIYFRSQLLRYAAEYHKINGKTVNILCVKPNRHMLKTNPSFYEFLKEKNINEISYSATINRNNHIVVLAAINPKFGDKARLLAEKVSACFSMALYNKNHLKRTELSAKTDALTGLLNRASYEEDVLMLDNEKPSDFSCVFVDVNELHLCNNKYGHAAGDEMLVYIANTIKEIFFGHRIYRVGGDEFLVFCKNLSQEKVQNGIREINEKLKPRKYHVATGLSFRSQNTNTEEMVSEAEKRMYEEKLQFYQDKEAKNQLSESLEDYLHIKTGMVEVDTLLSALKENYNGVSRVALDNDRAKHILMPKYLVRSEMEEKYSEFFTKYVDEMVAPDYHRTVLSFLNYDALKKQLAENKTPKIRYKKKNDDLVVLTVYKLGSSDSDTLWVFARG